MKKLLFISLLLVSSVSFAQDKPKVIPPNTPVILDQSNSRIDVKSLEARIKDLQAAKEQAIANVNAIAGAIQEDERLLSLLNSQDKNKKEVKK